MLRYLVFAGFILAGFLFLVKVVKPNCSRTNKCGRPIGGSDQPIGQRKSPLTPLTLLPIFILTPWLYITLPSLLPRLSLGQLAGETLLARLFVLCLALAVFAAILIVIVRHGDGPRRVPWMPMGILLGIAVLLFFWAQLRTNRVPDPVPSQTIVSVPVLPVQALPPTVWQDDIDQHLLADKYPSAEQAAYILGLKFTEHFDMLFPIEKGFDRIGFITHVAVSADLDNRINEQLCEGIRQGLTTRDIQLFAHESPAGTSLPTFELYIKNESSHRPASDRGRLSAILNSQNQTTHAIPGRFCYERKLWLTDLNAYQSEHPGREFEVVYSQTACTTPQQADTEARAQARNATNRALMAHHPPDAPYISIPAVEEMRMVRDRFSQKLSGQSGPVHRQAMLVETTPTLMQQIHIDRRTRAISGSSPPSTDEFSSWEKQLQALLALIGSLLVLYMLIQTVIGKMTRSVRRPSAPS